MINNDKLTSKKLSRTLDALQVDNDWTLYLDRDGVINNLIENNYVKNVSEFILTEFIKANIKFLSKKFRHIIVITNQQGVGKKLMTEKQLIEIHQYMIEMIKNYGGRIDKVLYCTDLENTGSKRRKPEIGMGLESLMLYPEIIKKKSVMIGDSISDKLFAKEFGINFILLSKQNYNKKILAVIKAPNIKRIVG